MNKHRMNQILTVLLFPFCDFNLGKEDLLYRRYEAYEEYLKTSLDSTILKEKSVQCARRYNQINKELVHYLSAKMSGRIKSLDDILQLCELYYPMMDVKYKLQQFSKGQLNQNIYDIFQQYYLLIINKIAKSMLTYRDGVLSIRAWEDESYQKEKDIFGSIDIFNKVEVWNLLCRFTVPDIYMAAYAVECGLTEEVFWRQRGQISLGDKLLLKYLNLGLAENHLHFYVGFGYDKLWIYKMKLSDWIEYHIEIKDKKQNILYFQAALFRYLAAIYFERENKELKDFRQWIKIQYKIFFPVIISFHDGVINSWEEEKFQKIIQLIRRLLPEQEIEVDYLLSSIYNKYQELNTSSEFLFLYQSYKYARETKDVYFTSIFMQYLRLKNSYFQYIQQRYTIEGLNYFQEMYGMARSETIKEMGNYTAYLEAFRTQAQINNLRKLEIRVTPEVKIEDCFYYDRGYKTITEQIFKQLALILYAYRQYILELTLGVQECKRYLIYEKQKYCSFQQIFQYIAEKKYDILYSKKVPTIGIVYHFLKNNSLDNISGYFCWRNITEDFNKFSNYKLYWRQSMINLAFVIEDIRNTIPKISEYLVGIDAASNENAMEPWILAPIYNSIRNRYITKPVLYTEQSKERYQIIQNLAFTYHVGEDFRHIVSGLRHIDEVVSEFHYKAGDRLGHAIALGMDIDKWASDNEVIPITIQEYLENLLWIWGKNVYGDMNLPIQLEKLEKDIINLAEQIYKNSESITVHMLYKAYKKKFITNHIKILQQMDEEYKKEKIIWDSKNKKIFCYYSKEECELNYPIWTVDKLLCTNYCPVFEERFSRVILISINSSELNIYKMLQEDLLKKIERLGIYVEVNPTSNITIGKIEKWIDHPIFRMNSLKEEQKHHIMVMVNSDDPIIFNTNVENELAYIYYALAYEGYPKEDILDWIDKIRKNGLNGSFIQKEKTIEQMLQEIGEILDCIKNKTGDFLS